MVSSIPTIHFQVVLLMDKILHQLIGSLSHYLTRFYTHQAVQDFVHQQYVSFGECIFFWRFGIQQLLTAYDVVRSTHLRTFETWNPRMNGSFPSLKHDMGKYHPEYWCVFLGRLFQNSLFILETVLVWCFPVKHPFSQNRSGKLIWKGTNIGDTPTPIFH